MEEASFEDFITATPYQAEESVPSFIKDIESVKALQEFLVDPRESIASRERISGRFQTSETRKNDSCSFVGVGSSAQQSYNCMNRTYILAQYADTVADAITSDALDEKYVDHSSNNKKNTTVDHRESYFSLTQKKKINKNIERDTKQSETVGIANQKITTRAEGLVDSTTGSSITSKISAVNEKSPKKNVQPKQEHMPASKDRPIASGQSWIYVNIIPVQVFKVCDNFPLADGNSLPKKLPYTSNVFTYTKENERRKSTVYEGQEDSNFVDRIIAPLCDLSMWVKEHIAYQSPYEESAILRLLCIMNSLDPDVYKNDPIKYQVVRRTKCEGNSFETKIVDNARVAKPACRVMVTTLPTAVKIATNSTKFKDLPEPFNQDSLDREWTMVPMRTSMPSQYLVPYIAAFMTSRLWAGRINVKWNMDWYDSTWRKARTGIYYGMPRCNSVEIPGPKNVMLVIFDSHSHCPETIRIANVNADVYERGRKTSPCDFTAIWEEWFRTENIQAIRDGCLQAIIEIRNFSAIEKTYGTACALAAELYGGWQPGIYTWTDSEDPFSNCLIGAYAYGNPECANTIDEKNGKIKANDWSPKETDGKTTNWPDNEDCCKKLVGFNFASHSPLLRYASGSVPVRVIEEFEVMVDENGKEEKKLKTASIFWCDPSCNGSFISGYRVRSASSLNRLSVATGFIFGESLTVRYCYCENAMELHKVALEMASKTNMMILKNNISLRYWMGIDTEIPDGSATIVSRLSNVVSYTTNNRVFFMNLDNKNNQYSVWSNIFQWYEMSSSTSQQWMNFSGLPFTLTCQWAQKLKIPFGDYIPVGGPARLRGTRDWAVRVRANGGINNVILVASNDAIRYLPKIKVNLVDNSILNVPIALEQWSMISLIDSNPVFASFTSFFQTNTFSASVTVLGDSSIDTNNWYIVDSKMALSGYENNGWYISPLYLPIILSKGELLRESII